MGLFHFFHDYRRKTLDQEPFPPEWAQIIDRSVSFYQCLHPDEQEQLQHLIGANQGAFPIY